ncbi:SDR family NAD(P)-dependent oxidoreductase [Mesorhizobium australicum]|uniref:NAD(P)-dependent dehydrogenase, short-chain alcohol dehydrogenase family n=1 Tax=Mesorhizobium australicum TaxID=536018 RepID=A0A1X7PQ84_9HYPH|nr:SDR family oxidoreductase [Mesorhizobium australicum]SMH54086.1 NAD(P)-dependent dehydrogenase, short-chain alcohol dehydrogenase family [Mesorhizobium australicum]
MAASSQERVAAITGGAGGIGEACVARMRRDGWRVVVLDRNMDLAREVAAGHGAVAHEIDLADAGSIADAARWVEKEIGPCSALAAVAAHLENPHMPQAQDFTEWEAILRVNLTGTFRTLTAFGAGMLERGNGSIVTVGSITAFNSSPLQAYGPTKAAIINMTRNFAVAWGRQGVRVNCVCPGPTRTPAVEASYARGERNPDTMIRQTALGRLVKPEQVANAIGFLLSDDAGAITGIELPVDAGTLATQLWGLYGGVPGPAQS